MNLEINNSMPNPLGRRRSASNSPLAELEKVKAELENLKAQYVADMTNISADMGALHEKISVPTAE